MDVAGARNGLRAIRRWANPPGEQRSPVKARNFGPQELMSHEARDFVGREGY